MTHSGMHAELVWAGGDVLIPAEMDPPREDQMLGPPGEQLSELAGRVCYDSLGTGRSSDKYHRHLLQVKHFSTHEHYTRTLELETRRPEDVFMLLPMFLGRKGLWVEWSPGVIRVTMNIRSMLEWEQWRHPSLKELPLSLDVSFGHQAQRLWHSLVPRIVQEPRDIVQDPAIASVELVEPLSDHERWVSLYLTGSRGFSHEQVRHGDETAISQRSTRYVEESESPWVEHPLVSAYLADTNDTEARRQIEETIATARSTYDSMVEKLQGWLLKRLPPDLPYRAATARKQGRGAARGYLGNALHTALIFSASVHQWRHMITMRAADAADAEIRQVFAGSVVPALKASPYGDRFEDIVLTPASDGLGLSLESGGAA